MKQESQLLKVDSWRFRQEINKKYKQITGDNESIVVTYKPVPLRKERKNSMEHPTFLLRHVKNIINRFRLTEATQENILVLWSTAELHA